jgi:hypothetical protein
MRYRDEGTQGDLIPLPGEKYIPDAWMDVSMTEHADVRTLCFEGMIVVLIWHPGGWDVFLTAALAWNRTPGQTSTYRLG